MQNSNRMMHRKKSLAHIAWPCNWYNSNLNRHEGGPQLARGKQQHPGVAAKNPHNANFAWICLDKHQRG